MRKNKLILVAALVFAAAQLPALGARAELTPQHQAALQQVADAYGAGVNHIQAVIDGNAMNQLQSSQNPLVSGLANGINNADTPADAQDAVDDFMEAANAVANSGGTQFMTAAAQAELGDAMAEAAMSDYAAFLQAEAAQLAKLKVILKEFKRIRDAYRATLAKNGSEQVGMNDSNLMDRQQNHTAYLAGLGQRIARGQSRVNQPHHIPRHPPRVEVPR